MKRSVETEAKLSAWPGLVLPDLTDVVAGVQVRALPDQHLEATYFDTEDLRLARAGVSLRHRTGEGDPEGTWTVKLPDRSAAAHANALSRQEISTAGTRDTRPSEITALVRALVRSSPLQAVATLETRRRRTQLLDEAGRTVAEIDDDEVSVRHGRRLAERFREIEVEVEARRGTAELLAAVCDRLVSVGAVVTVPVPKLVRALGPEAVPESPQPAGRMGPDATMAEVVGRAVSSSLQRLLRHDPGVRMGGDIEDVHQARVATRRLRSDLQTFEELLLREVTDPVRSELKWLADVLGEVRDLDVLGLRLRKQGAELSALDKPAVSRLLRRLDSANRRARTGLLEAMDSDRYISLIDALEQMADEPPMAPEAAELRAGDCLPAIVRGPWRKLVKEVAGVGRSTEDEALHEIRIRAKRARYAAEAAEPALGKGAGRLAEALAGLQSTLGDLQDAVVAEDWLRSSATRANPDTALVAGHLIAIQRRESRKARRNWPSKWEKCKKAASKATRSWLDS